VSYILFLARKETRESEYMENFRLLKICVLSLLLTLLLCPTASVMGSSIVGEVTEAATSNLISGANIQVLNPLSQELVAETTTDSNGYYEITDLSDGDYIVKISAQGFINQTHEVTLDGGVFGETTLLLDVQLNPSLGGGDGDGGTQKVGEGEFPLAFLFQLFLIVTIALIISLIMYSKIKKENLLKNALRNRIFQYITENPGIHYRAILSDLDLPMGVLSYHLNRLEKGQHIKSRQDGMYRRFYIKSTRTEVKFFLSEIQESILSVIKENQGISQSKIANKINVSRKVVNYHVNILDQAGLIYMESRGRESACFINNPTSMVKAEGS
jgi:predicted transcriptional regulator